MPGKMPAPVMEAAEKQAALIDGGVGECAIAAIAAMEPGPRGDLEARTWARRVLAKGGRFAFVLPPGVDSTRAMTAFGLLHRAVLREVNRREGRR